MDVEQTYAQYLSHHFGGQRESDASFRLQARYFEKNYLPHMPKSKDARIVDLGTGLGHFLFFLRERGYTNILGVDVGKEVIEFCRRKGLPVVESEIIMYLENLREPVDCFILNDVLEHQVKPTMWRMLEGIRASLKEGGVFLVKVPNMGNPLLGNDGRYIDITHEVGFDQHSMKQTLLMAMFREVKVMGTDIYVTESALKNFLARTAANILNKIWLMIFKLYGRTDTTIFTKNILAVAKK